jgi:SAM-dependent methyltransferase
MGSRERPQDPGDLYDGRGDVSEAATARQYDRWIGSRSATGRGFRFLASVPGSMIVNTPIFKLHENLILKPEQHVLDLGCGSGSLLRVLASRVAFRRPPVGVDLSREMLVAGRAEGDESTRPIALVQAAGTQLPLQADEFDVITCSYVLKHLSDEEALLLLREILRVLKPGGFGVLWEFGPVRSRQLNAWHRWLLTRGVETCNLRSYGDITHMATAAGFDWVENARLRPFLLPPIPRVSVVVGKAPESWRERTGPGRARRASIEANRPGDGPQPDSSDTVPVP